MPVRHGAVQNQSFLLLFFKKEVLFLKKAGVDASLCWHDEGHCRKAWMPAFAGMTEG